MRQRFRRSAADRAASRWLLRLQARPGLAEGALFRRWIARAENAEAYARAQQVWSMAGGAGEGIGVPALPPSRRPGPRAWAACLSVLLVAGGIGLAPPEGLLLWRADYAAPAGRQREVVLADGTRLLLDAGSAVDVLNLDGTRELRMLRGQVLFDVARNGAPFIVHSGPTRVEVMGTRFDILLSGAETQVTLDEGAVTVASPDARVALHPGQRLRLSAAGAGAVEAVGPADLAEWQRGRSTFHDSPLAEVLALLERHLGRRILLLRGGVADRPVSGTIRLDQGAAALDALAAAHGLRVTGLPMGPFLLR